LEGHHRPKNERRANVAAGAGYVIAAKTKQPEPAWTFLKFLSGFKGQAIFAESGVAVPARRAVAQSEVFMQQRPVHNAQVFLDEVEIGRPTAAFPGSNNIIEQVNTALVPVWQGQKDAAAALKEVLPQVEECIIDQAQETLISFSMKQARSFRIGLVSGQDLV
jgi:multiple sugar transport system substrate-binding protein